MPLTPLRWLPMMAFAPFIATAAPTALHAQDTQEDTVVARVGAEEVHISEIVGQVLAEQQRNEGKGDFDELYSQILDARIDNLLVINAAKTAGIQDDPMYQQRLERIAQQLLGDLYLQREIVHRVSPDAVQARYDEMVAAAEGEEQVKARHLVAKTKEEAEALREKIVAGEDFAETAKGLEFPGAENGGDLGWFGKGEILAPIADAAMAAETGVVTEPVETPFGWHLILVEERRPVTYKPFEEVQNALFRDMSEEARDEIVADLRAETTIERFKRDGTPIEPSPAETEQE
jgi:peptidyl-prolyl cis-trans isomerase C